jgi:biopolymer transport protein ExbB
VKNIFLLSLAASSILAVESQENSLNLLSLELPREQTLAPEPSENLAQQQIESFFEIDEVNADLFLPDPSSPPAIQPQSDPLIETASAGSKTVLTDIPNFLDDKNLVNEEDFLDLASMDTPSNDSGIIIFNQETVAAADGELSELEAESSPLETSPAGVIIDFGKVFSGSPTIYSFLILLSVGSFFIWLYTTLSLRTSQLIPKNTLKILREKLTNKQYPEALTICDSQNSVLFKMLASGISSRAQGTNVMMEAVRSEGKRATGSHWQKIGLLNDIAIIAPMLGLLGTVLGMFYAFYDVNRSMESISAFFDGLGISVGTTVSGLLVAILAMIFHSLTKYKLVKQLNLIENEAKTLTHLIDVKE